MSRIMFVRSIEKVASMGLFSAMTSGSSTTVKRELKIKKLTPAMVKNDYTMFCTESRPK